MANVTKSNTMNFQSEVICTGMSEEDLSWSSIGGGVHLPGAPPTAHAMSGMQGGVGGWFHEGPSKTISYIGANNSLVLTTSQSDRTPPAHICGQLYYHCTVMSVSVPSVSWDVPHQEWTVKPLQQALLGGWIPYPRILTNAVSTF